ncbi:MAG: response regulator transcription factor [Clostridiales bacterium]|nr:response regulator transcription factor [Clostridiales bacterium]
MSTEKILIIEDERVIVNFLRATLSGAGYQVLHAATGREALLMASSHLPELLLLDLGLPDMDGMAVLRQIREWADIPVIIVSARQDEQDKVACLDAGANDYITKPFGNSELLARIRASLRQHTMLKDRRSLMESCFTCGGLSIHYARREVSVEGRRIHLTPIEYKLIVLLSHNAGVVLTHDFILREIWGPFASDSQLLRVNMANIRRKIEPDPADPRYILTEVGVGYRMADNVEYNV